MGRLRRRLLSWLVYPVYRWLVFSDRRASVTFAEQSMLTGIAGTARKPS
jgi:hypothetical protein